MTYPTFSSNAPTGESAKTVVSTNTYSPKGRTVGYPTNFDLYVQHIADEDGSQTIVETREVSDLVGNKLYLYHRPLVATDGTVTTITVSDGTLDASSTNAAQGYVVFSVAPTSQFTVSYTAAPDCDLTWGINNLQNSVMEIEKSLGPKGDTSYPGVRNLQLGLFDNPTGVTIAGEGNVLTQGIYLSHLDQDIQISSSDDPVLQLTRGSGHNIQIGNGFDNVTLDSDTVVIQNSIGGTDTAMTFGSSTGDTINWKGSASGAGHLAVGGPEYSFYSGTSILPIGDFDLDYYSGSALRVHGNASFLGEIKTVGTITVVNTTGTTSVVLGDWTVKDELFVEGVSHLIGRTETNRLDVQGNLHIDQDIIADNQNGAGGLGQSLVDNLDCSEVAHTYSSVIQARHANSVIDANKYLGYISPQESNFQLYKPGLHLTGDSLVGEQLVITGQLNAAPSNSGAHPNILQLLLNEDIVAGSYDSDPAYGTTSGIWSPGLMQPGMLRIKMTDGVATGFDAPIYGYTVEETGNSTKITRLNVFVPETFTPAPQTNDKFVLYSPGANVYDSVQFAGGSNPTFNILALPNGPLVVAAETTVRKTSLPGGNIDITAAVENSASGQALGSQTGVVYIFADCNGADPELAPVFKGRATPWPMKGQVPIAEATFTGEIGSTWHLVDQTCYRPNGYYDSAWIPVTYVSGTTQNTLESTYGRSSPLFITNNDAPVDLYFRHNLGPTLDFGNIDANFYVGTLPSDPIYNQTHSYRRSSLANGDAYRIPLGSRTQNGSLSGEAEITYLDSTLIGLTVTPNAITGIASEYTPKYFRLTVNKNN